MRMVSRWSSAAFAAILVVAGGEVAAADAIETFTAQLLAEEREHLRGFSSPQAVVD